MNTIKVNGQPTSFLNVADFQASVKDLQLAGESMVVDCIGEGVNTIPDSTYVTIQGWNSGPNNGITINFINGYKMGSAAKMLRLNEPFVRVVDFDSLLKNPLLDYQYSVEINAAGTIGLIEFINPRVICDNALTKHPSGFKSNSAVKTNIVNPVITGFKDSRGGSENNNSFAIIAGSIDCDITVYGGNNMEADNVKAFRETNGSVVKVLLLSDYAGTTEPPVITPPVIIEKNNPSNSSGIGALSVNASFSNIAIGLEFNDVETTYQKQGGMHEVVAVLGELSIEYRFNLTSGKPVQAMIFGALSGDNNTVLVEIFNGTTKVYDELATLRGTNEVIITAESFSRVTPDHITDLGDVIINISGTGLIPDADGNEAKLSIEQAFVNYVELQVAGVTGGASVDNSVQIKALQDTVDNLTAYVKASRTASNIGISSINTVMNENKLVILDSLNANNNAISAVDNIVSVVGNATEGNALAISNLSQTLIDLAVIVNNMKPILDDVKATTGTIVDSNNTISITILYIKKIIDQIRAKFAPELP